MKSEKLALDMLQAIVNVLEDHNIPSKYYVEFFGKSLPTQLDSITQWQPRVST